MKRNRINLVPCFCQLCNGRLVTRYFHRKHTQAYCDTKQSCISNVKESGCLQSPAENVECCTKSTELVATSHSESNLLSAAEQTGHDQPDHN